MQWAAHGIGTRWHIGVRLSGVLDELRSRQLATIVGQHGHRCHVARLVHVVGGREDRNQGKLAFVVIAIALGLHFVGTQGHPQAVVLHEVLGNIRAEQVDARRHASGRSIAILALGVRPQQVHHERILIRVGFHETIGVLNLREADLDLTSIEADLVIHALPPHSRIRAGDAAMHHEDLVVEHVAQGRGTEDLGEEIRHLLLILHLQFTKEAVEMICHFGFVVATVHAHTGGLPNLQRQDGEHHLHTPGATIHKVSVEEELIVRRRQACQAQHVVEVKELSVQIAHHCDLLAYGHVDASQGLLLDQDVEGIDGQLIGILHGQQLAILEARQHLFDGGFVEGARAHVARSVVAHRLRHGIHGGAEALHDLALVIRRCHGDLVLLNGGIPRQILEAIVAAVDARAHLAHVAARHGRRGLRVVQHGVLHGHRQIRRLVAHAATAAGLEDAGRVVQDLVIQQVHDVPEIPGAHVESGHALHGHVLTRATHPGLTLGISGVPGLFAHLPNHGALAAGARRIGQDAEGSLLVLHRDTVDHR
mmetsp:Transcript_80361/g.126917  ORF Transcript_80361/g.126917 Transcript_80361/m.126917 type:complete len:535 (-) Transcript_80361:298-1902(-)